MKTKHKILIGIISLIAVFGVGLLAYIHHLQHTSGILDVHYQQPTELAGNRISTYFNGERLSSTIGPSATFTLRFELRPKHFVVRVEMDGAKPFERTLNVRGNGSRQDLDVILEKQ